MLNKDKLNALLTEYKSDFSDQWEKANLNDILEQLEKQQRVDWDNYRIRDKGSLLTVQS